MAIQNQSLGVKKKKKKNNKNPRRLFPLVHSRVFGLFVGPNYLTAHL